LLAISLHVSNVKALQYLETGVYSIIYNLRLLIVTILGILFLSEDVVWLRILGGVLIFLAIVVVKQKGSRPLRAKGFEWGIIAAFVISFLNLTEKTLINRVGIFNYLTIAMIAAAIIMWAYLILIKKEKVDKNLLIQPQMLQLMVLRAISAYSFPFALAAGALLSVANYISGMSVILMVVMGTFLLKEKDYLFRKLLATGVAVIGLTIVLISGLI
jgi:drug/metabolite transporter (DMT)-like permease